MNQAKFHSTFLILLLLKSLGYRRNVLYRDMKCGRICLSHGGQLPVLHRRKGSQHFMNQAKFHSTFPILLLLKSLILGTFCYTLFKIVEKRH